ncbi:MAG: hypothetical protein Q8K58_04825 [Acidimicrobiales bacterium]|nr:hypothetical protein [Acidimicrobiales bacterium]
MDFAPLELARADLHWTVAQLWMAYFALGGLRTQAELGEYLQSGGASSSADHGAIVQALNEEYLARGGDHPVPYSSA